MTPEMALEQALAAGDASAVMDKLREFGFELQATGASADMSDMPGMEMPEESGDAKPEAGFGVEISLEKLRKKGMDKAMPEEDEESEEA